MVIRTNFQGNENSPRMWKGAIPTTKEEKMVLNNPIIKNRVEYMLDNPVMLPNKDMTKWEALLNISSILYELDNDFQLSIYIDDEGNEVVDDLYDGDGNSWPIGCPSNAAILITYFLLKGRVRKAKRLQDQYPIDIISRFNSLDDKILEANYIKAPKLDKYKVTSWDEL